jgi:preprotein translocase subunit SecB
MSPEQEEPTAPPRYYLERFQISRSVFETILREPIADGETRPPLVNVGVQMNANILSSTESMRAVVTLEAFIVPDRKWQPYRLEVTITGGFRGENMTAEQFDLFCKLSAPPILFPYIRETVHRQTMDAPFGPVKMDPLNVSQLLNNTPWSEGQATVGADGTIASTEPPQPSER